MLLLLGSNIFTSNALKLERAEDKEISFHYGKKKVLKWVVGCKKRKDQNVEVD